MHRLRGRAADLTTTTRPALRWTNAHTVLEGFGMVTYAVEPARLARLLPAGVDVDERAASGWCPHAAIRER